MINKYQAGNKFLYEVFVKGRDKNGKQVGKRRRGITSARKAKEIEGKVQANSSVSNAFPTSITWPHLPTVEERDKG